MRLGIRKIASVAVGAVMLSSTVGFAAAASYPAPFVVGGEADGAVIVGSSALTAASDWAGAVDIADDLSGRVTADVTDTEVSGGDAKSLASGSDLVYLNDELNENVETITDSDLKTALADQTFTDDAGTEYDYTFSMWMINLSYYSRVLILIFGILVCYRLIKGFSKIYNLAMDKKLKFQFKMIYLGLILGLFGLFISSASGILLSHVNYFIGSILRGLYPVFISIGLLSAFLY